MKRFILLSHVVPPTPSGQSIMIYRILSRIDPREYLLVASQPQEKKNITSESLPAQMITISREPSLNFHIPIIGQLINLILKLGFKTIKIRQIIKNEKTPVIIACTGSLVDIPAAYIASRLTRVPFIAYIFDDYAFQWVGFTRLIAKFFAWMIFRRSEGIIVTNQFLSKEYQNRYGIKPTQIANPCAISKPQKKLNNNWPAKNKKITILYTGSIYHANYDCFLNLFSALEIISELQIELHIYTNQKNVILLDHPLINKKIFIHDHHFYDQISGLQNEADILFLPLSFENSIPEVIRTSSPGKMGEYLASGRPILAHVPSNSFVAYYCRKFNCASLVTTNSSTALVDELRLLHQNRQYRERIIKNAQLRSQLDFNPETESKKFKLLINEFKNRNC